MVAKIWVNFGSGNGFAWRHQAIAWTNADISTLKSYGIRPGALSWEDLKKYTNKTRMKFEFLKSHPDLTGTNELINTCYSGIILCMSIAYERQHYNVASSLIGWAHAQNDQWLLFIELIWGIRKLHYIASGNDFLSEWPSPYLIWCWFIIKIYVKI